MRSGPLLLHTLSGGHHEKNHPDCSALTATLFGQVIAQSSGVEIYNDKANWNPFYNQMGDLGAKSGVPFKGVTFADTSSYQAAVRTSLGSSKAPPMFTWWSGYRMKDLVDTGMVEDLTALWTKYEKSGEYSPDAAKAFTFGGKVYAIPNNVAYWAVFYNKKAYADAGITPPKTWAQLEANNAKLKAKGVTAFGQTVDGRWPAFIWFSEFLIRQDPDFYEKLVVGKAKYTDPQVTKTFSTWKSWMDKGYLSSPSVTFGTSGGNGMAKLFAQGKIANILVGDWYASTLQEAGLKPGSDYGMFILPNMSAAARPGRDLRGRPDPGVQKLGGQGRRPQGGGFLDVGGGPESLGRSAELHAGQQEGARRQPGDGGAEPGDHRAQLPPDQPHLGGHAHRNHRAGRGRAGQVHARSDHG